MSKKCLFLIVFFGIFSAACVKKPAIYKSDSVMEEFDPHYLNFNYLTARARIILEEQNGSVTKGNLHIRSKKDSIIWFSITPGLGIEGVRGLVTRDQIRIKDRINGNNLDMSYEDFEKKYGIKLTLDLFQNIFYANIPHSFNFRDRLLRIGNNFELSQKIHIFWLLY